MKDFLKRKRRRHPIRLLVILALLGVGGYFAYGALWGEKTDAPTPGNVDTSKAETPSQPSPAGPATGNETATVPSPFTGSTTEKKPAATAPPASASSEKKPPVAPPKSSAGGPKGMTQALAAQIGPSPITTKPVSQTQALAAFTKGHTLYESDSNILEARRLLNQAYTAGTLPATRHAAARKALSDLANRTVLKIDTYVNAKDPYLADFVAQSGEMLNSKRDPKTKAITKKGVIAANNCNVPAAVIVKVNRLSSGAGLREGKSYKLLKGPFHVVVYKKQRAADLYLQDLFVRRIPVTIGKAETPTPEGYFRIPRGGKTRGASYNPPAEMDTPNRTILPGQVGYPLDALGHNMKIEGIRPLGTAISDKQSYAVHGTNAPASLGSAASRGCIRVGDKDVQLLYAALQEYGDPTDPRISWTRWSTITIKP